MPNETLEKMWNILTEYDFQIDAVTKSKITCTSCKNLLIKPYNVPCGCRYCYVCLITYLNGEGKFCLGDSEYCKSELIKIDNGICVDNAANIEISRIVVKCPMESCEFNIELGKMADHMQACQRQPMACPYYTIGCDDDKIGFNKMKQHFTEENYSHARLLMDFVDNWKNEIKLFKIDIKKQMESKQETISALEENVAKLIQENRSLKELKTMKLYQKIPIKEMISALQENVTKLLQENRYFENNQKQMEIRMENLFQENKSLRDELETVKENMDKQETVLSLQTKIEEQEQEIKAYTKKVDHLKQRFDCKCDQIEKNEAELKTTIDKMSQDNVSITTESKQIENAIKILETKVIQIQADSNCSVFLWCIKNWNEKLKQAQNGNQTLIFSDPFCSHKNGYKMRLGLYPDGLGTGSLTCKGTHLSLYVCILRGEFDNILEWPFRHEVKLELLNQKTCLAQISKTVNGNDNPTDSAWKKPTSERNDGRGYHDFIGLSELNSNVALSKGNQIWIKATTQMKL